MDKNISGKIAEHFGELKDPRVERTKEHHLLDIIVIAICAVICGSNDWEGVAEYGRDQEEWLGTILALPNGIPSHDTFWRVFRALDAEQFERCFVSWMQTVVQLIGGEVVAIDGKMLRRSHDKGIGRGAIDMVSAWASQNRLVLGQSKVDEKSNEITAIPALLEVLLLKGCIVTIDAMGCHSDIAELIVKKEADYLLQLKENQPHLYQDTELLFNDLAASGYTAYVYDTAKTYDKEHGRMEIRHAWTISDPQLICHLRNADHFKNLQTVMKVQHERRVNQVTSLEVRYYLSSLNAPAAVLLAAKRAHWQIENAQHWVLDIAFREDESRLRKGNGAENFAVLRRIALNLLQRDSSVKLGIYNKRLKAARNPAYLLKLLASGFI